MTVTHRNFINGRFIENSGGDMIPVLNPATEQVISQIPNASAALVGEAVAAAKSAQKAWERRPAIERAGFLRQISANIRENAPALARAIVEEQGKVQGLAEVEVAFTADYLDYMAEWARRIEGEIITSDRPGENIFLFRQAIGVVGGILPWNFPFFLIARKLAPALITGNTIVIKPSEETPNNAAMFAELLARTDMPAGVVNMVFGKGATTGAALCDNEDVGMLSFTGSVETGSRIMAAAARNITKVNLELGGKAPAIVCADYPLKTAAARIASGKWFNAGQTCIGVDYALVDAPRRDAFVAALREEVVARFGDLGDARHYTRIINDTQLQRLQGYLADARARGCQVIELISIDPARVAAERLLPPTLVIDPPDQAAVMQHEIFGPVLPIRSYARLDDAIAQVNRTERPLALYPFSHDRASIERILADTLAGGVTVNDTLVHFGVHELPFGGVGPSGIGALHGQFGFDTFSKLLPVFQQSRLAASDWIKPPYRGKVDALVRWLAK